MAKIDIRDTGKEMIDEIIISDDYEITGIRAANSCGWSTAPILYAMKEDYGVSIESLEQAENTILAIKKAIELGWFKE